MTMQHGKQIKTALAMMMLGAATTATAQSINLWRGCEIKADWNDPYKWSLQHAPSGSEAVHFRQDNSVITVNSTIELDNGMMLYGQDLFLEGYGNINLWNPVPHKSTVNIPASATGYANLTLGGTLALNARIALAAKAFGTSDSKGSVTLENRSIITGKLLIGNNGSGSGRVFIRDQSTYRISGLELHTLSEKGGAAEIHILGGTAHLEAGTKPFEAFLADPGRKIIIGDNGKLRIDSDWPIQRKKESISEMISNKCIVAARGCQLTPPALREGMILLKAEFADEPQPLETLLADIEEIPETQNITTQSVKQVETEPTGETIEIADTAEETPAEPKACKLESLLKDMRTEEQPESIAATPSESMVEDAPDETPGEPSADSPAPLIGYIVFLGAILFFMRPAKTSG